MSVEIEQSLIYQIVSENPSIWDKAIPQEFHKKTKREKYTGPIWVLGSPDNHNAKHGRNGDSEHKLVIIYNDSKFKGKNFECYFSLDWKDRKQKYYPVKNTNVGLSYLHQLAAKRISQFSDIKNIYIADSRKGGAIKQVYYFKENTWMPYAEFIRKVEIKKEAATPSLLRLWICYKPVWQQIRRADGQKPNATFFPQDFNTSGKGYHVALDGIKEWVKKNRLSINSCVQKMAIYRGKDGKHVGNIYENGSVYFIDKEFEGMVSNKIYLKAK